MQTEFEISFLDVFGKIEDPRSKRNRLYAISEILFTALCAAICGAEGWQDVEDYGKMKIDFLRKFLPYKNGIPSDDTFRRFFRALNPQHFQELFRTWVKTIQSEQSERVIAIDGKSARHSFDDEKKMLHMINAYATEARLVLAQEKVDEKSNEITAIPQLLEWLDVKGNIITIDAMGCQYEIANKIIAKEGNYIFALKGNQSNLRDDVKTHFDDLETLGKLPAHKDYDKGHGRIEIRTCWVSNDVDWLHKLNPHWSTIKSIIRIDSIREIKEKKSSETRYYISSLTASCEKILASIRSHWAIENNLHWILDMSFNEDQSRIRKENAPQIMAIVRHIALNLLQLTKGQMKRQSIKRLRKMAGWDDDILTFILTQKFS
ncbi:MAG TPA: ISAs1 family transposase [Nitrosopumilaceae archaeon]|jgi:predicted transposase YbfD/YdcC|nr:ISAs1 family transposase [Nitrosopumilaceae archaeon]